MLRKHAAVVLVAGMFNLLFAGTINAGINEQKKRAARTEKVKTAISKVGTGPNARVEVKLYDKTKLKGFIQEANVDHFMLLDSKTGSTIQVPYSNVQQVKGNNLHTGVKIAIGVGLILLLAIIVATQTR